MGGGGRWVGGQGGSDRRSEVFVEIRKKKFFFFLGGGGSGRGVRSGVGEGVEVARFGVGG